MIKRYSDVIKSSYSRGPGHLAAVLLPSGVVGGAWIDVEHDALRLGQRILMLAAPAHLFGESDRFAVFDHVSLPE